MTLLLDASVWLAAMDPREVGHDDAFGLIRADGHQLAALDLTTLEVIDVLAATRQDEGLAQGAIDLMDEATGGVIAPISPAEAIRLCALVASTALTAYDGAYVVAAASNGWQLVSLDIKDLVEPGFAITPAQALGQPDPGADA